MKTIKFTKVNRDELAVLQSELLHYSNIQRLGLHHWGIDEFLNALIAVDTAHRLWISLRKKLESDSEAFILTFSISEAVIVFKCCYWLRDGRTDYQKLIAGKYKNNIDEQLKSLTPGQ